MKQIVVGVGDCRMTDDPKHVLVTYALGSCIAIAVHDPASKVGGLLHFMLPDSAIDPDRGSEAPYKYADTGIPLLLSGVCGLGALQRRLVVRIAGGAKMMDASGVFDIGRRNYQAVRRMLWKAGVLVQAEAVGGAVSRTVRLEIGTGRFWLREAGGAERELSVPGGRQANAREDSWHIVF